MASRRQAGVKRKLAALQSEVERRMQVKGGGLRRAEDSWTRRLPAAGVNRTRMSGRGNELVRHHTSWWELTSNALEFVGAAKQPAIYRMSMLHS